MAGEEVVNHTLVARQADRRVEEEDQRRIDTQ